MPATAERSGSFATEPAIPLLRELVAEQFCGSLRAEREGVVKVLYLNDGLLACASSTDPEDRLGPLLLREGRLTAKQLELAEEKAVAGEALGSVLVNLGFIGPADLLGGAKRQVERVVASLAEWPEGQFRARPGPLPERAVNLKLTLPTVVLSAVRAFATRQQVTASIGTLDAVLELVPGAEVPPLGEQEKELVRLLDARRDLRSVFAESSLDDFEAAKVILGLYALGLVQPKAPESVARRAVTPSPQVALPAERGATREPDRSIDPLGLDEEFSDPPAVPRPDTPFDRAWDEPATTAELPFDAADEVKADWDRREEGPDEAGAGDDSRAGERARADADDPGWDEPLAEGERLAMNALPPRPAGGSHRTWLVGGILIVLGLFVGWAFLNGDSPAPSLDTTNRLERAGDAGTLEAPPAAVGATPPAVTPPDSSPGAVPAGSAASESVIPAPSGTPPQAAPGPRVSPPPPAVLEKPQGDAKLLEGEGYEAGLAAFRRGDMARAAALWSLDPVRAHPDRYTLQVLIACEPDTLAKIHRGVDPSTSLFLAPVQVRGRACYRVCWGVHRDRDAAEAARATVPAYFRSGEKPLPVLLGRLVP